MFHISNTVSPGESRQYHSVLKTLNGGQWGEWGPIVLCREGYANGFSLKPSYKLLFRHLNVKVGMIRILGCSNSFIIISFSVLNQIHVHQGAEPWQDDMALNGVRLHCTTGAVIESLSGPQTYHVENTAANNILFMCENGRRLEDYNGLQWGVFGGWRRCSVGSICGIQTKVQPDQGDGDDTSLNDVRLFCCERTINVSSCYNIAVWACSPARPPAMLKPPPPPPLLLRSASGSRPGDSELGQQFRDWCLGDSAKTKMVTRSKCGAPQLSFCPRPRTC
ncbi:uncharacterized protein LOC133386120 [Rhineura floridana]|uniref:uncharacterized protein LOC133386120 n=1 Tax=Rhineura floridana TaxID=261503 RepID=UPI002AC817B4|nr:uncharacterized protein LOC133386120 [Rhineura floridana]